MVASCVDHSSAFQRRRIAYAQKTYTPGPQRRSFPRVLLIRPYNLDSRKMITSEHRTCATLVFHRKRAFAKERRTTAIGLTPRARDHPDGLQGSLASE